MGAGKRLLVTLGLLLGTHVAAQPRHSRLWTEATHRKIQRERSHITNVAKNAMPAVVSLTVEAADLSSEETSQAKRGVGSGFVVHPDGYVLTNFHVVEGAGGITATLTGPDGLPEVYVARIVGSDPKTDSALLKIDARRKLPVLPLGSTANVEIADWVVVIGNPFGLAHSVTVGVVSSKHRTDVAPDGRRSEFDYLQTDASINPGNSGGPVLDVNGNVVAIANALNISGQGIGFAIPIDVTKAVLPRLFEGEVRHGWLGATVSDLTSDIAVEHAMAPGSGVFVSAVENQSPADRAGLRPGDIIMKLDAKRIRRAHTLRRKLATSQVGESMAFQVRRQTELLSLKVKLAEAP